MYIFFLFLFFSNFIVVQVQFSASLPFPPTPCYCPCVLCNCSYKPFTIFPWNSLPSPLWSLSAFSQFQCLWLYFACFFVLLTRFLLMVRSYGICLSVPALLHLAKCFPVPPMLWQRLGAPSFFLLHRIPLCKCTTDFFIHSFTDGHLGCFQHLAIVNCTAMNIAFHKFFWIGDS